jgi:hypothetical protein
MTLQVCSVGGSAGCRVHLKRDGTRAGNRFRLSPKRTSPLKSAGASVLSTAGSRYVHISVSDAGYTTFRGSVRVLATHSIRQFPLHFPSRASPCAISFQRHSTKVLPLRFTLFTGQQSAESVGIYIMLNGPCIFCIEFYFLKWT